MNTRLIWLLIGVMLLAITGLVGFQINWINNSFDVKEKHFNQLISRVLSEVCRKIETQETIFEISNEVYSLNNKGKNIPDIRNLTRIPGGINDSFASNIAINKQTMMIHTDNSLKYDSTISLFSGDSIIYSLNTAINNPDEKLFFNNDKEKTYNELQNYVIEKVNNKTLFVEKIVNKLLNYNENINERIDSALLSELIKTELLNEGINLEYEYAIKQKDSIYLFQTKSFDKEKTQDLYKSMLFPNDLISTPNHLIVYFPKKDNYLIRSLGFMGASSILLTLIIVFVFSFTLFVLFKQKRLSDIKNDFVNNMTHELKTPISTISLASQMLQDKNISFDESRIASISNIIDEESKRLGYQVEKVLQAAIYDKGKISLKINRVNINHLIQKSVENFTLQLKNTEGNISLNLISEITEIEADEFHMTNVFYNLLDNSIKYSRNHPKIKISSKDKQSGVLLIFEDEGIGIGKDDLKRIFEKFYRVPTGNIHNIKGFGLGLSYVKKIVDAHKGIIKVSSELGMGTIFEIYLPEKHD
ncbi:MAG: HAMP domain-containing sensor histidine kinase [Bacteroidota bacterium]